MYGLRNLIIGLALLLGTIAPALAQDHAMLVGDWTIRVTEQENPSFSGTAKITYDADNDAYLVDMITEDTCCGGANYAKVRQSSQVDFDDGQIMIDGKIEEFLIREEERPEIRYSADNFRLRRIDDLTLIGVLNGYVDVEWTKRRQAIS